MDRPSNNSNASALSCSLDVKTARSAASPGILARPIPGSRRRRACLVVGVESPSSDPCRIARATRMAIRVFSSRGSRTCTTPTIQGFSTSRSRCHFSLQALRSTQIISSGYSGSATRRASRSPTRTDSRRALGGPAGGNRFGGFPFRHDNRKPDGTWDAPDATDDNIKGTSVDPYEPMWPRWKQTPPLHGEGEFISDQPFFDIDEISQKVEFYPSGRPLTDKNVHDNPASRQRVGDMPSGNFWRRRLLVDRGDVAAAAAPGRSGPSGQSPSMQTQSGSSQLAIGDLTTFQVISRNRGGGARNSQAYAHWLSGSGRPLDVEFSDANVESSLTKIIGESASGKTGPSSFQSAINQSLANNGAPVFVDTTAGIDTGGAVIGRVQY